MKEFEKQGLNIYTLMSASANLKCTKTLSIHKGGEGPRALKLCLVYGAAKGRDSYVLPLSPTWGGGGRGGFGTPMDCDTALSNS